jgi:hypothetical protein
MPTDRSENWPGGKDGRKEEVAHKITQALA